MELTEELVDTIRKLKDRQETLDNMIRELKDRQEILDCIQRYARGMDRGDRELVLSAYHPDAIDDHGSIVGTAADFVDWALGAHEAVFTGHHDNITSHTCELDGDTAHAETYCQFEGISKEGPVMLAGGRYVDRFERRNGRWAIAARVYVAEWVASMGPDPTPEELKGAMANCTNSRDKNDISYMRPLRVTRPLTPK